MIQNSYCLAPPSISANSIISAYEIKRRAVLSEISFLIQQERETIERISIGVRSMKHGINNIFDPFKDLSRIGQNLDGVIIRTINMALQSQTEKIAQEIVQDSLDSVVSMIEVVGATSKNGSLTFITSRKYINIFKSIIINLREKRVELELLKDKAILSLHEQNDDYDYIIKNFDKALSNLDALIDKMQSRFEISSGVRSTESYSLKEMLKTFEGNNFISIEDNLPHDVNLKTNRFSFINALVNLLSNALYFAKNKNGDNARVILSISQNGNFITIVITDNGPGIPHELLDSDHTTGRQKLFNLNISQRKGGTGLGTTEAWYVIKDIDGKINATSDPSVGATFTITVPISIASRLKIGPLKSLVEKSS